MTVDLHRSLLMTQFVNIIFTISVPAVHEGHFSSFLRAVFIYIF